MITPVARARKTRRNLPRILTTKPATSHVRILPWHWHQDSCDCFQACTIAAQSALMPGSSMCHRSLTGRMCNNHKYFCSPDKQDIGSLGHLHREESESIRGHSEHTSAVSEVYRKNNRIWGSDDVSRAKPSNVLEDRAQFLKLLSDRPNFNHSG